MDICSERMMRERERGGGGGEIEPIMNTVLVLIASKLCHVLLELQLVAPLWRAKRSNAATAGSCGGRLWCGQDQHALLNGGKASARQSCPNPAGELLCGCPGGRRREGTDKTANSLHSKSHLPTVKQLCVQKV